MKTTSLILGAFALLGSCVLTSCDNAGPEIKLKKRIVSSLESVDDKSSADDAAQEVTEALKEFKKERIEQEALEKRISQLMKQIGEKNYYDSYQLKQVSF